MHSSTSRSSPWRGFTSPLSRGQRRALVVAMYLAFAAFVAVLQAGSTHQPRWPTTLAVPAILLFIGFFACFARLLFAPGYVADTGDRALDERQRAVRNGAYRTSYLIVVGLFLILSLILLVPTYTETQWIQIRDLAVLLPWAAFILGSLPTAVVAWNEPDSPRDE